MALPIGFHQVQPYFQPQICCDTGAVAGFELFARLDPMTPRTPALLDTAAQRQLARIMLGKGLEALRGWNGAGLAVGTISLNVTAAALEDAGFADFTLWELDRQDVDPGCLVFEVAAEAAFADRPTVAAGTLSRLAAAGCGVDLDGFDPAHTGLDALRRLPVRRVKVDRQFVARCDIDRVQQATMLSILAMAERAGLRVVAQGVATAGEHGFVAQMGCSHVQGATTGLAMPLNETPAFLMMQRARAPALPASLQPS